MSLINRMLRDLDRRQRSAEGDTRLPAGVQAVAPQAAGKRLRPGVLALAAVGLVLAAAFHFSDSLRPFFRAAPESQQPVSVPTPASPAPQTAPPAAAVPVAPSATSASPASGAVSSPAEPSAPTVPSSPPTAPASPAVGAPIAAATSAAESRAPVRPPEPVAPVSRPAPPSPSVASPAARPERPAAKPALPPAPISRTPARTDLQHLSDFHYRQALDAYALGRTSESLTQSREALRHDPDHLDARQLLLRQLIEQREIEPARLLLREGLARHPEQGAWVRLLLRLELERGDLTAARMIVEQASPAVAAHPDFRTLAGMLAQRQGRHGEAAEHFRLALARQPGDGRAWIALGLALEAQGHEPESREAFRRALQTEGLPAELQSLAQKKTR